MIGAGQAGLSVAARLGRLNVDTLIVEKNSRVGDNWRSRYEFLALHDPVWVSALRTSDPRPRFTHCSLQADHLPYLPFPESWPVYAPKDKVGDWLESYAKGSLAFIYS